MKPELPESIRRIIEGDQRKSLERDAKVKRVIKLKASDVKKFKDLEERKNKAEHALKRVRAEFEMLWLELREEHGVEGADLRFNEEEKVLEVMQES